MMLEREREKIATRIYVESRFRKLSDRTYSKLPANHTFPRETADSISIRSSLLATLFCVSELSILQNKLAERYVRRYRPKYLIGYKTMALGVDQRGFHLRSLYSHVPLYTRDCELHALCSTDNPRADALTHAQKRLNAFERGEIASVCECGIYAISDPITYAQSHYHHYAYPVVLIRPFGIVEISDYDNAIRCTDAIVESVHLCEYSYIGHSLLLEGIGHANATLRSLTQRIRDDICQAIADDLGVDVVYHHVRIEYHLQCHARDDVTVYHPRDYIREVLDIVNRRY